MKFSVVIPCYNEAENLSKLIARFREAVDGRSGVELLLVNNGSTDRTSEVLELELADPRNKFARVVTVPQNRGYGFGIVSGLRAARGEFLGWTHADLQTDPVDVFKVYDRLLDANDPERCFLRGRRIARGKFDAIFTFGMSCVASTALGVWLHDINAQPKIFHRSFFDTLLNPPDDFSLDLYVLFKARMTGLRILELPVHFGTRTAGEAKGGGSVRLKYKLTKRTLAYILDLRRGLIRRGVSA